MYIYLYIHVCGFGNIFENVTDFAKTNTHMYTYTYMYTHIRVYSYNATRPQRCSYCMCKYIKNLQP